VEEDVVDVHVAGRGDEQGVRPGHAAVDRDGRLRAGAAERLERMDASEINVRYPTHLSVLEVPIRDPDLPKRRY
jgi:hypothetical protein